MNINFADYRVTLVVAPIDLRSGYDRLCSLVQTCLGIDLSDGKDMVVFVSRKRTLSKIVWSDERGNTLLMRRLHQGRFEQFLAKVDGAAQQNLSSEELNTFLDGKPIMVKRSGILVG